MYMKEKQTNNKYNCLVYVHIFNYLGFLPPPTAPPNFHYNMYTIMYIHFYREIYQTYSLTNRFCPSKIVIILATINRFFVCNITGVPFHLTVIRIIK